ncbi:MAG TPA: hypothetical protein VHZ55_24125, partial [Bryobacteraceae bacterium]|nr:hypothetical protein [Bryobacteraceae bacterium]
MTIPLSDRRYPTIEARNNFLLHLLEDARQIPGLTDLAFNAFLHPFVYFQASISAPGQPGNANTPVLVSQISSAYPKLVNTHLLQGRLLTQADIEGRRR